MIIKLFPAKTAVQQDMDNYINSFASVLKYCHKVEQITMPLPSSVPKWYTQAMDFIANAQVNASSWKSSVCRDLTQMPRNIVSYKPLYQVKAKRIQQNARALANDLQNAGIKSQLIKDLSDIEDSLDLQIQGINNNINNIGKYRDLFQADLNNLGVVCREAETETVADQILIKDLKKEINNLETKIEQLSDWITIGEITAGAGVAIVSIAVALNPVMGIVAWIGVVVATIGTVGVVVLEIIKIGQESALRDKKNRLTDLESTILNLGTLEQGVKAVFEQSNQLMENMQNMTMIWSNLKSFAGDVRDALEDEKKALSSDDLLETADSFAATSESVEHYFNLADKLSQVSFAFDNREITDDMAS
ncbi:MAG: HBL/NHE enterotoxin family protein [Bacillota bacterium]